MCSIGHNRAMDLLAKTLETPAENLALDEALLDWAEAIEDGRGILRLWEPERPFVVLGRSSRLSTEVDEIACRDLGVPIYRRSSGGAAIVAGPGCLMFAVIVDLGRFPSLRAIDQAHRFVLDRHVEALRPLDSSVVAVGTSDLAFGNGLKKFSGNSLRIKQTHLLYHGTILYHLDLSLIARCLGRAPREPEYRDDRKHTAFVANLPVDRDELASAIRDAWSADQRMEDWPEEDTRRLVEKRYATSEWTRCFA